MSIPLPLLMSMVSNGSATVWRVGNHPPANVDQAPGLILVQEGELIRRHLVPSVTDQTAPAGCTIVSSTPALGAHGDTAYLAQKVASSHVTPRLPTDLVMVPRSEIESVLAGTGMGAYAYSIHIAQLGARLTDLEAQRAALETVKPTALALVEAASPGVDLLPLVEALGAQIKADFVEDTVHVGLYTGPTPPPRLNTVWQYASPSALGALRTALINMAAAMPTQVLVTAGAGVNTDDLREVVDTLVQVDTGPTVTWPRDPMRPVRMVYTALADPLEDMARSGPSPFPPGAIRLRWAPGAIGAAAGLSPEQLSRWARAVTDRRVGIACGGGGSLAYSHLAVLHHLAAKGVPVDVVSGVSFGTVVAAYWAEFGTGSVEAKMLDDRWRLQFSMLVHILSGEFAKWTMNGVLGDTPLEGLEHAMFPIATDVSRGSQTPVLKGSMGQSVRASGGFPPIFPATPQAGHALVDGGFSANVPALVLQHEGVRLVIASDAVAAPRAGSIGPYFAGTQLPSGVRAALEVALDLLDPRRRWTTMYYGGQALMNTAGELSAANAPAHFEAETVSSLPPWLLSPEVIIHAAENDPGFGHALKLAVTQWDAVREPR